MTDAESNAQGLSPRSWTRVSGILPLTAVATIAAACVCAAMPVDRLVSTVLVVAVVLGGVLAGLAWNHRNGADGLHRRVARTRAVWVRSWHGASAGQDGEADPRDVALALPRGWRVEQARGRVRFTVSGTQVRAETWVLKAVVGSRRAPRRREVVLAEVPTSGARVWVPLGVAADSMLVTPAWAGSSDGTGAVWLDAVRGRVAAHDDVLASLVIGDDRVILFASDDPRPEAMRRRAELVRDVVALIQAVHGRP